MHKDLKKRVRALLYIRVVVVTLLLDSLVIFNIGLDRVSHPAALSYFIAFLYFLTVIYALILRGVNTQAQYTAFAYVQIIGDVLSESVLIYLTGGIDSMFSFIFPMVILSAGIILDRRACYIISTLSSALYTLLLCLQYFSVVEPAHFTAKDIFYNIFAHVTVFYMVGFLSGSLSEKLQRATRSLEERDTVLSDLKAFSKYIIESIPSGILTTDPSRKIVSFNTAAQDITMMKDRDVTGKTIDDIFPFLRGMHETKERVEGEFHSRGESFPVGMRLSKLKDGSGSPIGLIGVFQDLTELKAMEAEVKRKEKWAFIGELSASIAHELRNPLASLKGSIEMLREKKVSEEHAEQLMRIALSEMDRLNGIVTDFLLYARPQELHKTPFDVNQVLSDVITLLQSSETKGENVKISPSLKGSMMINGDSKKVQQVFWNLGINAMDAVSSGGTIDISTAQGSDEIEIVFKDSGRGISEGEIDKVFYPFFTTKDKGTGLGLSIAQKIIEDHGGKITVSSEGPGEGTTFAITLPAKDD